jgi:hypothetical protein
MQVCDKEGSYVLLSPNMWSVASIVLRCRQVTVIIKITTC